MAIDLWVYTDESGRHQSPSHFFLLGYMASAQQWTVVKRQWSAVLNQHDIEEFHAHEFFNRQRVNGSGPFDGWSDEEATAFLEKLISIIASAAIRPIGGCVDVPAFLSYSTGDRRHLTGAIIKRNAKWKTTGKPSDPYLFLFHWIIKESLSRAKPEMRVHLVFDTQKQVEGVANIRFGEIRYNADWPGSEKLVHLSFENSTSEPALQVADLRNYFWQRAFLHPDNIDETLASLILKEKAFKKEVLQTFGKKEFDEILSQVNEEQRKVQKAEL